MSVLSIYMVPIHFIQGSAIDVITGHTIELGNNYIIYGGNNDKVEQLK